MKEYTLWMLAGISVGLFIGVLAGISIAELKHNQPDKKQSGCFYVYVTNYDSLVKWLETLHHVPDTAYLIEERGKSK